MKRANQVDTFVDSYDMSNEINEDRRCLKSWPIPEHRSCDQILVRSLRYSSRVKGQPHEHTQFSLAWRMKMIGRLWREREISWRATNLSVSGVSLCFYIFPSPKGNIKWIEGRRGDGEREGESLDACKMMACLGLTKPTTSIPSYEVTNYLTEASMKERGKERKKEKFAFFKKSIPCLWLLSLWPPLGER